jgi:hypothetical protein
MLVASSTFPYSMRKIIQKQLPCVEFHLVVCLIQSLLETMDLQVAANCLFCSRSEWMCKITPVPFFLVVYLKTVGNIPIFLRHACVCDVLNYSTSSVMCK